MSWPMIKLDKVITFIRGVTFKPDDQVEPFSQDSIVVMRTKNVQTNGLDTSDLIAIPKSLVKRQEQILVEGDILMSSANSWELVGKSSYVENLGYISTAGGFISTIRAKKDVVCPRYLFYWIMSPKSQHNIRYCGRKTTNISNLDVSRFKELKIPLPPLDEQKRIAAILDKADAIRQKRKQAISLADEFLRSVFLEMFGDPVTNPKGWEEPILSDIADVRSGVTKGKKLKEGTGITLPYMRVANVQDGYLDLSSIQTITVSEKDAEKCKLLRGDILLTEGGDPDKLGRGHVWNGEIDNCIHQNHIFSVRVKDEDYVRPAFLSAVIGSQRGKRYFLKVGKQTTGIATINKTVLSEFCPIVPPLELQDSYLKIASRIKRMQTRKHYHEVTLFPSLSQKAFSGQL
ncbi:restriction endonuclease subunit S [Vibrio cholerae]